MALESSTKWTAEAFLAGKMRFFLSVQTENYRMLGAVVIFSRGIGGPTGSRSTVELKFLFSAAARG